MTRADTDLDARLRSILAPPAATMARLQGRLAEVAAQREILDVAYALVDTPLGALLVAATPTGIIRLAFENEGHDAALGELAVRVSPRVLEAPARLDCVRRQLDEYFAGSRIRFDVPLDWALSLGFHRKVLAATERIDYGRTSTYRSVATEAGNPAAARAAGTALATNPIPILVPCHRVLRSDGCLGGYLGGTRRKDALLHLEATYSAQ